MLGSGALRTIFATVLVMVAAANPAMAEDFQLLSGAQVASRFVGHMLTDDTHWRETYQPGGRLGAEQIGGTQMHGSWRVKGDTLCSVLPAVRDDCYAVWMAGDQVELRHPGYQPVAAFLRPSRQTSH